MGKRSLMNIIIFQKKNLPEKPSLGCFCSRNLCCTLTSTVVDLGKNYFLAVSSVYIMQKKLFKYMKKLLWECDSSGRTFLKVDVKDDKKRRIKLNG